MGVSGLINAIWPPPGDKRGDKYGSWASRPASRWPLLSNHASCLSALNPALQASTPVADTEKSLGVPVEAVAHMLGYHQRFAAHFEPEGIKDLCNQVVIAQEE
jgi:hypothetical protein